MSCSSLCGDTLAQSVHNATTAGMQDVKIKSIKSLQSSAWHLTALVNIADSHTLFLR